MRSEDCCNQKDYNNDKPGQGCGSEDITLQVQSNCDRNTKRARLTPNGSDTRSCWGRVPSVGGPSESVWQSWSLLDGESIILHQNSSQTCESDCRCEQNSPIKCENEHSLIGGWSTVSPFQCNNLSSLTCLKEGSEHHDKLPMEGALDASTDCAKLMDETVDMNFNPGEWGSVGVDFNSSSYGLKSRIDTSIAANTGLRSNARKNGNVFKSGADVGERFLVEDHKESGSGKLRTCNLKDSDLLISAILKKRTFKSTCKRSKYKHLTKGKRQKSSCKLPLPRCFIFQRRTVLSWLAHLGSLSLGQVIQYRSRKTDIVVKDGFITSDGILCRCCDKMIYISEFKRHAGFRLNRPCLNLFIESGKPFALCQLEAWSAEYKARKDANQNAQADEKDESDNTCGRCGYDHGELICCDNCPSTFHKECLYSQVRFFAISFFISFFAS